MLARAERSASGEYCAVSFEWSLQSVIAWAAVPPEAAAAATPGATADSAHTTASEVINRRIIAASLWGNDAIELHQPTVEAILAEPLAASGERRGAALGAQVGVSPQ